LVSTSSLGLPRYESFFKLLTDFFQQIEVSQSKLAKEAELEDADQSEEGGNISDWLNHCDEGDTAGTVEVDDDDEQEEQEFVFDEPEHADDIEVHIDDAEEQEK
jgi:hypothetical protein